MKKEEKTTAVLSAIIVAAVLCLIAAVAIVFFVKKAGSGADGAAYKYRAADANEAVTAYLGDLPTGENGEKYTITTDGTRLFLDAEPTAENAKLLYNGLLGKGNYQITQVSTRGRNSEAAVNISCVDTARLQEAVKAEFVNCLTDIVKAAGSASEVYEADDSYKKSVLDSVYKQALEKTCAGAMENSGVTVNVAIALKKTFGGWEITNPAKPGSTLDARAGAIEAFVKTDPPHITPRYVIDEKARSGPAPDRSKFIVTDDPAQITALLETKEAKNLIGEGKLVWNPDIKRIENSKIRAYLDETILMIQWQELESKTVGTFSEVFIADGSQLRRKIAGDAFGDMNFQYASDFGKQTNAVLAVGGDFYNHARNCGIVVYDREIFRFDPSSCDVCYITTSGDMLFSYRDQFQSAEEAKAFIDKNDVLFSLSFGPALIDNGRDVTPTSYAWGEIDDYYARAALGMLGERHYITMNMNCSPNHYYLATLRQAADAMIRRGCIKAYTLDGGQTATTVVNGELVNPVQFYTEKQISDIIYFATAVPEK